MLFELHDKSPPYSHYNFIREICLAWIDPDKYRPEQTSNIYTSVQDSTSTKSRARKKLSFKHKEKRIPNRKDP